MARPLLAATVIEKETRRAIALAREVAPIADLVEVRLDSLGDPDPERIVGECAFPVLLTCRPLRQGGLFRGPEEDRLSLLLRGVAAGPAWIDIEADSADRLRDRGRSRLVVSWHDFEKTPADLTRILDRIRAYDPDVAKIVPTARCPEDVVRLLRLLRDSPVPLAAHPMGSAGFPGRILAARFGSAIVYGAASPASAGAPGQPTLFSLREDYRLDRDLSSSKLLFLIGGKLGHSVSPRMMNRTFAAENVPALYVPVEVAGAGTALTLLNEFDAVGAAVTIPLKEEMARLVAETDAPARATGAVNTVVRRRGTTFGTNTDREGALGAIRQLLPDLEGVRAVVLGAGGAARAIVSGLEKEGARVVVVNRTRERGRRLATDLGVEEGLLGEIDPDCVDLVVNATPVGQWPRAGECPLPAGFLRSGMVVMDAVYNPPETRLLGAARAVGARTIPGIEMLARQGALQVSAWLGRSVSLERMRREGREALLARLPVVVLAGMRGAGKTTVGRILAGRLGREFVDLDEAIEKAVGLPIAEIFRTRGEAVFREWERDRLRASLTRPGIVLATGGGVLTSCESRMVLKTVRTLVIYLRADPETLLARIEGSARPSLTALPLKEEVRTLLAERDPGYREAADLIVDASGGDPDAVAAAILDRMPDEG